MSGLSSAWSDFKETFFSTVAYAEEDGDDSSTGSPADAKPKDQAEESSEDDGDKEDEKEGDDESTEDAGSDDAEEDEEEDEDDEDDEDEDEDAVVDPLDQLREKYTATVCHDFKHHFDECTERVLKAQEDPDYADHPHKEDCIEEFFHLQHCLNDHISPILFSKLK